MQWSGSIWAQNQAADSFYGSSVRNYPKQKNRMYIIAPLKLQIKQINSWPNGNLLDRNSTQKFQQKMEPTFVFCCFHWAIHFVYSWCSMLPDEMCTEKKSGNIIPLSIQLSLVYRHSASKHEHVHHQYHYNIHNGVQFKYIFGILSKFDMSLNKSRLHSFILWWKPFILATQSKGKRIDKTNIRNKSSE